LFFNNYNKINNMSFVYFEEEKKSKQKKRKRKFNNEILILINKIYKIN